ncbi:MAG TPA: MFS transporter [Xanthobacteraceae bacterium]|nr:MFS transporter [Xanthobacteraceae bacterium]
MRINPFRVRLPPGLFALRERNYVLYLIGQFTSQLGNWIQLTAVSWIIYDMTQSPFQLGLNGLFRAVPTIALGLVGGAVADRVPRRALMFFTESTMLIVAMLIGIVTMTGHLQIWHLYALNFISGTLQAFSGPARQALFAGLVPREAMQSAVTLNSVGVRGGTLIGPTLAGLALAYGSYALPFLINSASFVAMLVALVLMHLPPYRPTGKADRPSLSHEVKEGIVFVWKTPFLKVVLGLEIATGLFGYNSSMMTIIAADILGTGPQGLGLLLSATGAGAVIGMILLVTFHVERHARLILILGSTYTLLWAGFAFSRWFGISILLAFLLGTVDSMWSVTRNTIAQLVATDALRGRVMSVVMLVSRGTSQLGRVQSGFLVGLIGAAGAVLVGAGVIAGGILLSLREPIPKRMIRAIPPDDVEDR